MTDFSKDPSKELFSPSLFEGIGTQTVQPVQTDYYSEGVSEIPARSDHQHPIGVALLGALQGGLNGSVFKNLLHNGQFMVNQRALTSLVFTTNTFMSDRWVIANVGVGTQTGNVSSSTAFGPTPTSGRPQPAKVQYMQVTVAKAAGALAAGDEIIQMQSIEGLNVQHLNFGTPFAKTLTLSFDVYCTVSGTFAVELISASSLGARTISRLFTVVGGQWQTITLNYPGDTVNALDNDSAGRLAVAFYITAGSTFTSGTLQSNWGTLTNANRAVGISNTYQATINNVFALTNVQLEVGTAASPYEVLPYDAELTRCMRYFERIGTPPIDVNQPFGVGMNFNTTQAAVVVPYKVYKRAIPQAAYAAPGFFVILTNAAVVVALNAISTTVIGTGSVQVLCTTNATQVAGDATILRSNNTQLATIDISADI